MPGREGDVRAQAAIDALRTGVVNRFAVESITYGRDEELRQLETTIEEKPRGSTQILIGGYGVGKSHLCEVLALRLLGRGYAVVRLEMGASHGRAENPDAVLHTIAREIHARIGGRLFQGASQLGLLVRAHEKPERWEWDHDIRSQLLSRWPGVEQIVSRYQALREAHTGRMALYPWRVHPTTSLFSSIPSAMTAANLAVAQVNLAAHRLKPLGVRGLVVLFDEAERSQWAASYYKEGRARELMLGFASAAANKKTSHLKHYRNWTWQSYCEKKPSRLHAVFSFTGLWGLAWELKQTVGVIPLSLAPLGRGALREIERRVGRLYGRAYPAENGRSQAGPEKGLEHSASEDTRAMIRRLVAGLDHARMNSRG